MEENREESLQVFFWFFWKSFEVDWKALKMQKEESCKGKKKKEMMTMMKRMKKGAWGEEDPFPFFCFFFMLKKNTWKNFLKKLYHVRIPHPCTERTARPILKISSQYSARTRFWSCMHILVWVCALSFSYFWFIRARTGGRTINRCWAPNLQLLEDKFGIYALMEKKIGNSKKGTPKQFKVNFFLGAIIWIYMDDCMHFLFNS